MTKITVKSDSKAAEILSKILERKRLVQEYINGNITLEELNAKGVKFAQPIHLNAHIS